MREPVTSWLRNADLIFHIMRQMGKRVTLLQASLRRNCFVTAGKRNRLKGKESNFLRIVERKTNDRSDLIIVNAINQRGHEHNLNSRLVQVIYGSQLNIKKVPHLSVIICIVSDAIKLKIHVTQARFGCLSAKFFSLGKLNTVGCRLDRVVADLA